MRVRTRSVQTALCPPKTEQTQIYTYVDPYSATADTHTRNIMSKKLAAFCFVLTA